ncbi:hypothetical protein Q1695_006188 [Nippostrongylus brasiliensis]|nr:hypothetical protein Q1695_006188 [Nippostrongylus brasiliensis]
MDSATRDRTNDIITTTDTTEGDSRPRASSAPSALASAPPLASWRRRRPIDAGADANARGVHISGMPTLPTRMSTRERKKKETSSRIRRQFGTRSELAVGQDTTEETVSARTELVSSISSQVADGIGSIISQLVDKKLQEERKGVSAQVQPAVLSLKHPGLQAQASLLSKSITQVEDIEVENDSEEKLRKLGEVKKNLKRRLTTVVGADTDSSIFALADNFDKVEDLIYQTDDFGKAVAEHLKKFSNSKNHDSRKRA